jgi:hypothetical protein
MVAAGMADLAPVLPEPEQLADHRTSGRARSAHPWPTINITAVRHIFSQRKDKDVPSLL